jgi:hypothetical protein
MSGPYEEGIWQDRSIPERFSVVNTMHAHDEGFNLQLCGSCPGATCGQETCVNKRPEHDFRTRRLQTRS